MPLLYVDTLYRYKKIFDIAIFLLKKFLSIGGCFLHERLWSGAIFLIKQPLYGPPKIMQCAVWVLSNYLQQCVVLQSFYCYLSKGSTITIFLRDFIRWLQKSYASMPDMHSLKILRHILYCNLFTEKVLVQRAHCCSSSPGFTGAVPLEGQCFDGDSSTENVAKNSQKFMPAFCRRYSLKMQGYN